MYPYCDRSAPFYCGDAPAPQAELLIQADKLVDGDAVLIIDDTANAQER